LIGTSIAMAASRAGDDVRGWDLDPDVLPRAAARAGFEVASDLPDAVQGADISFVCAPGSVIPGLSIESLEASDGGVVTDVGSVKARVVDAVRSGASTERFRRFVGGHPMAGSERSGPDTASGSLLDGSAWVLTPVTETAPAAVERVRTWVEKIGGRPVMMDPSEHDRGVALVSHLPQLVSTALMGLAAREQEQGVPETLMLAAGGFRDLTRLAASNPVLWADILRSNRGELGLAIDAFVEDLLSLRCHLEDEDAEVLAEVLGVATKARLAMAVRPKVRAGVAILQVPVPDRPGALADLTTALSDGGVNIEDLQIVHSPEGGRGTVHLMVAGADAEAAAEAIGRHGLDSTRIA